MNDENQDSSSNDGEEELTQESLQQKLQAYHAALKSEFEVTSEKDKKAQEDVSRDYLRKHVPVALAQVVHLAQFSTSDSVRLNASKFIIGESFKDEAEKGDPIADLIEQLNKKPAKEFPRS